jgi:uncharacterized membrane protein
MIKFQKENILWIFVLFFILFNSGVVNSGEKSAKKVNTCFGSEPFWDVEINTKVVQFKDSGKNFVMTIPKPQPSTAEGSSDEYIVVYQGKTIDHQNKFMNIIIVNDENCSDGMSEEKYPFSAFVLSGKTLYKGCCK